MHPQADPGFWFGRGTGRGLRDRSPPAGSRPQKPEECYLMRLIKTTYGEKKKSIHTDIV